MAASAGSPRVGGVAGASSKLTLEIVCVRLAMSDGGLGSVADIVSASAHQRRLTSSDTKISKCKNLGAKRESGAALLLGGSDESGTSRE